MTTSASSRCPFIAKALGLRLGNEVLARGGFGALVSFGGLLLLGAMAGAVVIVAGVTRSRAGAIR